MIKTDLPLLKIRGKTLLPIFQGGMGVGVSAHKLAGTVAKEGGVGTIASIDLRIHHPDLLEISNKSRNAEYIDECNLIALDREIKAARKIAPEGFIAVNTMKAVSSHKELVQQACKSGADAIVMGAGLPLDLPEMTEGYDIALIPILADVRGVKVLLKRWMRKGVKPDAIILEHPKYAGGHLGATKPEEIGHERYDFAPLLADVNQLFDDLEIERIPLITAGGINSYEEVEELFKLGASGVQLGTVFAVTEEGDAADTFKHTLIDAKPEDIVTFLSTAGLPARAVETPWLKKYLKREEKLRAKAVPERAKCAGWAECLSHCGFRDGNPNAGQFCILKQLESAVTGDYEKGLFFRGSEPMIFTDKIHPVHDVMEYLLTGEKAA
jgi:nitronate monooxygenase